MKFQSVVAGVILCLAAQAADPKQVQPAPRPQQSLTGCVDEQFGHYVLLDDQMVKIVNLQSAGPEKEVFAKHLGHTVQVRGAAGPKGLFTVAAIEPISDNCGAAKK